jgi:acyl carrier protein
MSTVPALEDRIRALFVQVLNIDIPSDETDLIESGVIDSLALVELLFALEQEFSVSLPLDTLDIESFRSVRTIGEFIATVDGRLAE